MKIQTARERAGLGSPTHYHGDDKLDIQVIDLLEAQGIGLPFAVGNVVKYVVRADRKGYDDDLAKADWYMKWILAHREIQKEKDDGRPTSEGKIDYDPGAGGSGGGAAKK